VIEAFHPSGYHGYLKIFLNRGSPIVEYGGAIHKSSYMQVQPRKMFHLEVYKIIIINKKWNMLKEKVCY
jgi:hypothetical protein